MVGALCAAVTMLPVVAHAGGFLDLLFGGFHEQQSPPPAVNAYAEPAAPAPGAPLGREIVHRESGGTGRAAVFCVRLCDGENFPLQHFVNATPAETCRAMCPASRTKVFYGTAIDNAVAHDGARYADLDKAYVYRKRLVPHCTCNGHDEFGLAPFETPYDPTLRPGDIVVTDKGLVAYTPKRGQTALYTPVDPNSVARELNSVTVPPPSPSPRLARRAQPGGHHAGVIVESQNTEPQYLPPLVDLRGQAAR